MTALVFACLFCLLGVVVFVSISVVAFMTSPLIHVAPQFGRPPRRRVYKRDYAGRPAR